MVAEKLRSPQGLAAWEGTLFVAEAANATVLALDLAQGSATPAPIWKGVIQPSALAVHQHMLYVASAGQHAVFAKDLRSPDDVMVIAGTPGVAGNMKFDGCGDGGAARSARLFSPTGLCVDDDGVVYIADSFNGRVRMVKDEYIATVAGAAQDRPRGNRGKANAINIGQP